MRTSRLLSPSKSIKTRASPAKNHSAAILQILPPLPLARVFFRVYLVSALAFVGEVVGGSAAAARGLEIPGGVAAAPAAASEAHVAASAASTALHVAVEQVHFVVVGAARGAAAHSVAA